MQKNPVLQNIRILCYSTILTRYTGQKGAKQMATIAVDDSENLEKAIKRFKRMVEKEGIIREYKKREFYEKPSTILNRKNKALQRKLMKKTHPRHESKSAYWYAHLPYPKPIPYVPAFCSRNVQLTYLPSRQVFF